MATPYIADSSQNDAPSLIPDWREILAILMERAWIGLTVALVVFAVFFIDLKRSVPYYRSTAVLLVDAQIPRILNYQDVLSLNVRNLEYFNTIINTLHSRQMIERAVEESGLMDHPDFFPGVTGVVQKAASVRGLLKIEPVEKSRLINVTVEHPNPEVASIFANAMARAYIQQDLDNRMNTSMQAVEWLRQRAEEYRAKLETGLLELQKYREKTGSVSLEEDQNIVIAKLQALNASLTTAQTELIAAETQWKAAKTQIESNVSRTQVAAQMDDPAVAQALGEWRSQQQTVLELKQRYKPEYPDLREAMEIEQTLRQNFEKACEHAVDSLKTRYETLKSREKGLKSALKEQEQLAFSLSRQLVKYDELKRNVEADQEIYDSVISRMKETSISETLPTEIIRLAEEARPASKPFRPITSRLLLRGVLFGLAAGIGSVFLLYYSDHRFRRNEEVERALDVSILTSLPFISAKTVHERGTACFLDQNSSAAEAFRTLRAIIQVNPAIQSAKTFLVTSTQPSEGKSLVATNLAISFAMDTRKTLLVGADLRRPVFKDIFDMKEMPKGLSEVLKGECPWQETANNMLLPGLDVIASGHIPGNPSELLGNLSMGAFLREARDVYDRIIIDSSPMMGVSDSLLLMQHVDGVLFIIRQGVTHSLGAIHAMKRITESGASCYGAVMNGINLKSLTNTYYYRRYGGYAYAPDKQESKEEADT